MVFSLPSRNAAADLFPDYPEGVRVQAARVVEAAGPGKGEALERRSAPSSRDVRSRDLSMNAVPTDFERAAREVERKSYESLRACAPSRSLRPPLGLARQGDAVRFRLEEFLSDVDGLRSATSVRSGLLGYAVVLVLFASASMCWFAVWASINSPPEGATRADV